MANLDNTGESPPDELEHLLERLCLGDLGPDGLRRLGQRVRGDREATKRYIEVAHFCETLRDETIGTETHPLPPAPRADDGGEPLLLSEEIADGATPPAGAAKRGGVSLPSNRVSLPSNRVSPRADLVPWGIAVALSAVLGWTALTPSPSGQASRSAPIPLSDPVFTISPAESLGRVVGLTPAASSDGLPRSLTVGSPIRRGEVFQLTEGAARLELDGGEVLVEGPAELSFIDPTTVFVRRGQVAVRRDGEITVQTPVAITSGKNCAFAVDAEGDASARVVALDGEVVAMAAPHEGADLSPPGRTVPIGRVLVMRQNTDSSVTPSYEDYEAGSLLTQWESTHERLHDYERLVLSDRPLAYWPLSRVRRHRVVLDLTQNGFDGHAIGNWPTTLVAGNGSQERGAYFDGESYIEAERKPPVDLRSGFTIESWARVARSGEYQAVMASRWVLASNTENEQCFGYTLYAGSNNVWQFWTGSGSYGANWDKLHSTAPIEFHRWTHVAASFVPDDGQNDATPALMGTVSIYVDGECVAEAKHELSLTDFEWPARIGAAEFVPQSLTSWLFRGSLRDVALYDHPLSRDRIRLHFQRGADST